MTEAPNFAEQDNSKKILMPETDQPAVKGFAAFNEEYRLPVVFENMELSSALDLLEEGKVGAVLAGTKYTTGDVIREGIQKFNPRRNSEGEIDPLGTRDKISSFFVFERGNNKPFIMADCAVNEEPQQLELLEIAEQTLENAKILGFDPVVAFLSYSTTGSGHGDSSSKVRAVAEMFKQKHPDVPTIGEVQFDAATEEEIYRKKTKQGWPEGKAPNIFIVPNLDTGNTLYKSLQSKSFGGGWTAVGPLLQGFENNRQLHDLSRGAKPESLAATCKYIVKLAGLEMPSDEEVKQYG